MAFIPSPGVGVSTQREGPARPELAQLTQRRKWWQSRLEQKMSVRAPLFIQWKNANVSVVKGKENQNPVSEEAHSRGLICREVV